MKISASPRFNFGQFEKMKEPVECVLRENNGMSKSEVEEVVLVGGSTRIPGVQTLLRDYFGGILQYLSQKKLILRKRAMQLH